MVNPQEVDSEGRKKIEKYILRKAFDCPEQPYLPEEVPFFYIYKNLYPS
jgi:hypothetical protein